MATAIDVYNAFRDGTIPSAAVQLMLDELGYRKDLKQEAIQQVNGEDYTVLVHRAATAAEGKAWIGEFLIGLYNSARERQSRAVLEANPTTADMILS